MPRLLWNRKVHYRVHNSPLLVPVMSHMHSVHIVPPISLRSIIILSSHLCLGLPSGLFCSSFPPKLRTHFSSLYLCYMPRLSHPPWLNHPNNIRCSVQVMKLHIAQSSPVSRHFLPLRSRYSLSTLFSNTINVCSSLSVRHQVSHP
jgi:hypothetical protein